MPELRSRRSDALAHAMLARAERYAEAHGNDDEAMADALDALAFTAGVLAGAVEEREALMHAFISRFAATADEFYVSREGVSDSATHGSGSSTD